MSSSTASPSPQAMPRPIAAGARIGHLHLKVADLQRSLDFYVGVLGFELTQRFGPQAAFIASRLARLAAASGGAQPARRAGHAKPRRRRRSYAHGAAC